MPCAAIPQDSANELPVDLLVAALGHVGTVGPLVDAVASEAPRKTGKPSKEHLNDDVGLLAPTLVAQGLVVAVNHPTIWMLVEKDLDDALLPRLGPSLPSRQKLNGVQVKGGKLLAVLEFAADGRFARTAVASDHDLHKRSCPFSSISNCWLCSRPPTA